MFSRSVVVVRTLLGQLALVGLFSFSVTASAQSPASFTFAASGAAVSSSTSVASLRAISGSGVTWSAGTSGYVASASTAANASLLNQAGQAVKLSGSALTRVAANDMAASAVAGLRAGLPGLVAAVAITGVLYAASYYWDQTQQSMVYAPLLGQGPSCSNYNETNYPPYPDSSGLHYLGIELINNGTSCAQKYVNILNAPGVIVYNALGPPGLAPNAQCSNGGIAGRTVIDNQLRCPLPVSDDNAVQGFGPSIVPNTGFTMGKAITDAGGSVRGSELPNVQLNPGHGPTTTTTNPDGSQEIRTNTETATCTANLCVVTETDVATHKNPDGSTNPGTTTTTTPDPTSTPNPQDDPKTCGLNAATACFINETGTLPSTTPLPNLNAADQPSTDRVNQLPNVIGASGKDTDIPDVLFVPSAQSCTPFQLPGNMGSVDPCGPMESVRAVMDYIWALAGFWIIVGMVKKTIDGS